LNDSALNRFFGVVARPRTWLGIVFHILAFPLGLFYFVFLVTGLSVGVGLVIIWIGIPVLLVVAGAWWLFAAFERVQARYLLGAEVGPAPRPWENATGIWGKLKAHFGSGSTWRDLAYLFVKFPLGLVSFLLLVVLASVIASLFAMPVLAIYDVPAVNGTWVPPLWFGLLCVPLGLLALVISLHVMNAWGWICARWAEILFRLEWQGGQPLPPAVPQTGPLAPPEPLARPEAVAQQAPLAAPEGMAPQAPPVAQAPTAPDPSAEAPVPEAPAPPQDATTA
jgi:hypothetical protein